MEISREYLRELAKDILIDIDEDVIDGMLEEYYIINEHLNRVKNIDVEGVEPMFLIDEELTSYLREDEENEELLIKKEDLLSNAANKNLDYVIIKKVVE
ncbi:Asp-tRNA(Asn)/Glu-tRNA(Gln) amidotransferase subunit GatC [Mycoplasma phocimorsus]|uniref:Asp-tRNA(Asn)/Glu-tRNA(Gln) amidotransferase subunit GatC n=1 Tax=Mycoplasma phocimorsus TaxID=3045839 RepID=A0AAJ1UWI0_9MOLU|nr:Asp-tRNA(Asn)/Glu-tRNA(Gln) amidotransferase subunit GatC [Mycoplasma phocimorsus]MDJ1645657.1 Asp-tRNA(Asn)/Glu-tRNA(Gln) amidotransferase subunit GatC [Mycoplasma phocimorsus]MDJ1646179.1 Asp-tRNA(Asn)/Glu-tRNA(Gln) amidotransferase subunit GatC [Mycoplasma phocimorsus]MDJ1646776.1 Asp-tRNA(Asn)/Glu-tRNA(Gln) amidotransferase subunit GatC [Mycoplasma phocimorsus]MDJ1647751.1 Asp-tRNA(Asn)/Glu-tRNA(Gln) amidotransferase subunit GatC [Mycoplasma phocimorsus]MDJ1648285.1 Asp-tRNA(Asn)/Glu-tR